MPHSRRSRNCLSTRTKSMFTALKSLLLPPSLGASRFFVCADMMSQLFPCLSVVLEFMMRFGGALQKESCNSSKRWRMGPTAHV